MAADPLADGHEPKCPECGSVIQGAPFDGDPPSVRHCWNCQAIYHPEDEAARQFRQRGHTDRDGVPYIDGRRVTVVEYEAFLTEWRSMWK